MLLRLEISNYALIENVSIKLDNGFSVITGETGAGKSILLKALNLLLGGRADISVLKQSEKKCFLEAEFNISKLGLKAFFAQNELDFDEHCIVRREFSPNGKSRGFINDTPVQMNLLKELGDQLLAIHSQHEALEIFNANFQMNVLDAFAGIQENVLEYELGFKLYRQKVAEHIELQVKDMQNRKEKDYLSFLINELKLADLDNTDLDELKSKNDSVEHAEKISEELSLAQSIFDNDTYGPQTAIKTLIEAFTNLKKYDGKYADIHSRLMSLKIEMDDLANEIERYNEGSDLSPAEVQMIKEKMDLLNSLTFKHNLSEVTELKELLVRLESQLEEIDSLEENMHQLEKEIAKEKDALTIKAKAISAKRNAAAPELCKNIAASLKHLAMEFAELKIELSPMEKLGTHGLDKVEFLFKTNKGSSFLPIKKVASGGELSRLMLTILSLMSQHKNLPTLIFDEIDTGVSGEIAAKIANEFVKMGERIQLISITHLPQVAAKGTYHFHVSKSNEGEKTATDVIVLKGEDRINELAKMISGEEVTAAAKENAVYLLNIS